MPTYATLCQTILLDPINMGDETWQFKVEIYQREQSYFAKVWRLDFYDIKPTFLSPAMDNHHASEQFFVYENWRFDECVFDDKIACIDFILSHINQLRSKGEFTMNDLAQNPYLDVRLPAQVQGEMVLACDEITEGSTLSNAYVANIWGFTGDNISPELRWSNAPADTKSFVLTMYDPDAPTGCGFWHWNAFNIPADWTSLPKGKSGDFGAGIRELKNDAGLMGFVGAFPPKGDKAHRYIFTLYALSEVLELPADISPAVLGFNLNGKVLASTSLTAYYAH